MEKSEEKRPQKQFTGWWIPVYVVNLFEEKTITVRELILLATIDSLSKGSKGCFASNSYLSEKVQVGTDRISKMITNLTRLDLLLPLGFDGRRRRMLTYWSKNPIQHRQKNLGRLGKNTYADSDEIPRRSTIGNNKNTMKNRGKQTREGRLINKGIKQDSMSVPSETDGQYSFPSSNERKGKRSATSFDYKASAELHKIVSSHIKVNCTAKNKQWANQFSLMRTVDKVLKQDIRTAIKWYGKNIGKEFMVEAFSASSFRQKYSNGQIPAAMKRSGNGAQVDARSDGQKLVDAVLDYLEKDGTWNGNYNNPPAQYDINVALVSLGLAKRVGDISPVDCMS